MNSARWPAAVLLGFFTFIANGARAENKAWIPTWYASPAISANPAARIEDMTIRQIVHTTAGGTEVRIKLSNAYGTVPLRIDQAFIANRRSGSTTDPASQLRFDGSANVVIPAGGYVLSDPLSFNVKPQTDVAVSLYVSNAAASTAHLQQRSNIYFAHGNVAGQSEIATAAGPENTWASWLFLSEIEVADSGKVGTLVAFGDSITDGLGTTSDTGSSWPDRLFERMKSAPARISVINAGITGNRLTRPGQWPPFGDMGLIRFDRDVTNQPNVTSVFVLIGINDIGQTAEGRSDYVSPEEIESGLSQLAARAHEHGLRIYIGTLLPFKGAKDGYYSDDKNILRHAVNDWIRQNRQMDGFVDLDKALRDPKDPEQLRPEYDSGDHLHPNNSGAQAIADAIPLNWFRR